MWLAAGDALHGEICPECILRGPLGAAKRLRERIGERRERPTERRKGRSAGEWAERLGDRARLLETMESFPLAARQAAVREMRERR